MLQAASPGEIYGISSKKKYQSKQQSADRSQSMSPSHPRVVETVIGNYAKILDETNVRQQAYNQEMKSLASFAATDIDSTYKKQL